MADIMRAYVTAHDHLQYTQLAEGTVQCDITHQNLAGKMIEHRLSLHCTVATTKSKLSRHFGTHPEHMTLVLKSNGSAVAVMDDDSKMLGFYGVQSGMEIHIRDGGDSRCRAAGSWHKTISVANQREAQATSEAGRGRLDAQAPFMQTPPRAIQLDLESVAGMTIGDRCEVQPGARRGEVMFLGEIPGVGEEGRRGHWVGVKFDEPVGSSDGCVRGRKIFECVDKFGGFVHGRYVTAGDFPEVDEFSMEGEGTRQGGDDKQNAS
jgi:tubulin-folding cofactor B